MLQMEKIISKSQPGPVARPFAQHGRSSNQLPGGGLPFRRTSEEQKSQLIVSYDYLASIVLYSKYVIISQCTVMHVV